jgi:hypothetical protein
MNVKIVDAFKRLEVANVDWLRAIENRKTGSHWGTFMPWQAIAGLPWEELQAGDRLDDLHLPECDYYYAKNCLHPNAVENIKLLSEFDNFDSIIISQGDHGIELVSPDIVPRSTQEAWLIIGRDRVFPDTRIVWTAYPGKYAVSVTKHPAWDGTRECLWAIAGTRVPIAVKGLNKIC